MRSADRETGISDSELLRRVNGGDPDAFSLLFDRLSPVALGVLVRILGQLPKAEEASLRVSDSHGIS